MTDPGPRTPDTVIVLAMHGAPPRDFPPREAAEFFALHTRTAHGGPFDAAAQQRTATLDAEMRSWPRTAENDPFYSGSYELAAHLSRAAGLPVIVGFNEFCAPSLDEAFDQAAESGASRVLVITPMMTRGGEHSEVDIPQAMRRAQERHPGVVFHYVWPFDPATVADFLAAQITAAATRSD